MRPPVRRQELPGYRQSPASAPHRATETFVACASSSTIGAGRRPVLSPHPEALAKRTTEIKIQFKRAPHVVFRARKLNRIGSSSTFSLTEGISVSFGAKRPAPK